MFGLVRLGVVERRRRPRTQRGAAAVEFALVSSMLFTLVFGMLQYGWYFFSVQTASAHAREVARKLSVGDCWGNDTNGVPLATTYVKNNARTGVTSVTVTPPTKPLATYIGNNITVSVTVNGKIFGLLPLPNNGQGTRTVITRYEDATSSGSC